MGIKTGWPRRFFFAGAASVVALHLTCTAVAEDGFGDLIASAALERTYHRVRYDPSYVVISYPGGDVPADQGVCTDVVVRSYRSLGIDLQQLLHLDMMSNFDAYPKKWGEEKPNPNIDHRRVLNLQTFFSRHGTSLPITRRARDYRPGDLVTSTVPPNRPHIAIVSNRRSADGRRFLIVHNIGKGPKLEDRLFDFPITGHYRFRSSGCCLSKTGLSLGSGPFVFANDSY